MEKKNFSLEVEEIKGEVDKLYSIMKRREFLLENETTLAVRFSKFKKFLGEPVYDHQIATMICDFKDYESAGYRYDEALIAAIWSSVKWDSSVNVNDVNEAIEELLAYNPGSRVAYVRFKNNHRVLVVVGYLLWCVAIFFGTQYWIAHVTHGNFLKYFVPSVLTIAYFIFTRTFLKRKRY